MQSLLHPYHLHSAPVVLGFLYVKLVSPSSKMSLRMVSNENHIIFMSHCGIYIHLVILTAWIKPWFSYNLVVLLFPYCSAQQWRDNGSSKKAHKSKGSSEVTCWEFCSSLTVVVSLILLSVYVNLTISLSILWQLVILINVLYLYTTETMWGRTSPLKILQFTR